MRTHRAARVFLAAMLAAPGVLVLAPPAAAQEQTLRVTPTGGPVGTLVTLEGRHCETLTFRGPEQGDGTFGFGAVPDFEQDAQGDFRVRYRIPASLDPIMGAGGGSVTPGSYVFQSAPPGCTVGFTVIAGLASTGPQLRFLVIVSVVLVAAGASALVVRRSA